MNIINLEVYWEKIKIFFRKRKHSVVIFAIIVFLIYIIMRRRINKVVVFDLDETLGYFSQLGLFYDGLREYLDKDGELSQTYINELFDLYPEALRPGILQILRYLKIQRENKKCKRVLIYTNNQGPKEWANCIKNYFHKKLDYNIFDQIIAAFKVAGKQIEPNRTQHGKSVDDLFNCTKLPDNTEIFFLDDQYHPDMEDASVWYFHLRPYKCNLSKSQLIYRFLDSKLASKIQDPENFVNFMENYLQSSDRATNCKDMEFKKEGQYVLDKLHNFFKPEKLHNKSAKRRKRSKNTTLKNSKI